MHKLLKIGLIVIALLILSTFTIHAILNSMTPMASRETAALWLYTPTPQTIPLDGTPQVISINGFASYTKTEQVTIKLDFVAEDGGHRYITFVTHQGAFTKQVIIPEDFTPGWYGSYPVHAEMIATNGTVLTSSNAVSLTYTNPHT